MANRTKSVGLEKWFSLCNPVELVKFVFRRPMSLAIKFICMAKFSSEPAKASATTTQASFPDETTIPLIRFSTDIIVESSA